ncbi:hypothetical protein NQ318_015678 [Aromia moschata]|uniref:Transposase n=1 Tax=Aromia moschata TaxID=1265417 RepID=A0AAV8YI07_9CUCU|nr:hypothetical protein NQ318_015678 [Aromia moschata]
MERSPRAVMNIINETFRVGRTPIALATVQNTVNDLPRSGRPRSNEEKSLDVWLSFTENPHNSVLRAAQEQDISKSSVHNVPKRAKSHPFKVKLVCALNEDDSDRRVEFSEDMMALILDFPSNIAFSDEATFQLDGTLNRQNCRYLLGR